MWWYIVYGSMVLLTCNRKLDDAIRMYVLYNLIYSYFGSKNKKVPLERCMFLVAYFNSPYLCRNQTRFFWSGPAIKMRRSVHKTEMRLAIIPRGHKRKMVWGGPCVCL